MAMALNPAEKAIHVFKKMSRLFNGQISRA